MPVPKEYEFQTIVSSFNRNLAALRIFSRHVGGLAEEYDRSAIEPFLGVMGELFPEPTESNSEVGSEPEENGQETSNSDPKKAQVEAVFEDPSKRERFMDAVKAMTRAAPIQGGILRTSALITLISHFEALIADLIHTFYLRFPAALPADERSLTLAELRVIGSIEEAEKHVIAREVDSVLRETLDAQLSYFCKRPKVDLSTLALHRPQLVEIDQRRNLWVHNQGKVNRLYLERVDPALLAKLSVKLGEEAVVGAEYLENALNRVEVAGTILLQLCWRKWTKDETKDADRSLINTVLIESLQDQRHGTVIELAEFGRELRMGDEANERIVCIDHAIALRDSGRQGDVESVLEKFDWSACSLRFKLALAGVRNHEDEFYSMLPKAVTAEEITREELETWPLFRMWRETEHFKQEVVRLFHSN